MIEAKAVVLKVESGRVWLKVSDRQDGCGRCDQPGGCRSIKIAYALKPPTEVFSLPDTLGSQPGDRVRVRMNDGVPLAGALASYGLGATLLIVGAALGHLFAGDGHADLYAMMGAILGLLAAIGFNRMLHRSRWWRETLNMEVVSDETTCTMDTRIAS